VAGGSGLREPFEAGTCRRNVRRFALVSLLVVLEGCSSTAVTEPTPRPTPSSVASAQAGPPIDIGALQGRVVFSDETNDVWTMNADGTQVLKITSARAMEFDPTWSPDGSRIAYRHQSGDDQATEIYVMKADGSGQRNLTRNDVADWGPDWSPDGSSIVFNSAMGSTGWSGLFGYVMAPDGSKLQRLSIHYVEYPAWSPDGSRIAFMAQEPNASGTNPDYNIFVMHADGTDIERLTDAPGEDGWPAWSPDGSQIVFSSARDDCSISDAPDCGSTGDIGPWADVWIMDADGSNQRRLTSEFAQFFAWSPDGSAILVAGGGELFLIRPDGTGLTPFPVASVSHPLFPDWIS
jgi:Tol biopolymer transport system component